MEIHHHAYVIAAPREAGIPEARSRAQGILQAELSAHPDFFYEEYVSLSVDHARGLRERASHRPISGPRKAFVIVFDFITHEAQNALLKLLEEPPVGTHFFLVVPNLDILLPTVRSRLEEVRIHGNITAPVVHEAREFLDASLGERLALAAAIAGEKDKTRAIALLDGLSVLVHERMNEEKENRPLFRNALSEILNARGYLSDRSPSIKMLLEHVALALG